MTANRLDATHVLSALTADDRVAVPLLDLAAALDEKPKALVPALTEALALGWIEAWETKKAGRLLTMTPSVAAQLGREVDEGGKRWRAVGSPRKRRYGGASRGRLKTATDYAGDAGIATLNAVVDPAPSAHERVVRAEAAEREGARHPSNRPDVYPTNLIGMGVRWDGPHDRRAACRGCGGRELGTRDYCLICDEPRGTLAARAKAAVRRAEAKKIVKAKERLGLVG